MIIFIDESGDAGFRMEKGSSRTFVVVLVIFDDPLDAEETALNIKKLRRSLAKSEPFEFKFNKSSKELRLQFLETVKDGKFRIRAIVVQKEKIHSPTLRNSKDKFYNYVIKEVLQNSGNSIRDARIKLDRSEDRLFRRSLSAYLRKSLNFGEKIVMQNLRFCDSRSNVLIQLADMIAGSIRRSYDNDKSDCKDYLNIINKRIEDLWEFQ